MLKQILLIVVTAIVSVAVSQVGQYEVQKFYKNNATPVLVKNIVRTDLSGLPLNIQQQIPLIPVTYTLKYYSGAAAENVTIVAKSQNPMGQPDVKFSPDSENHILTFEDPNTIRIDVPTIRPNGLVSFQLITAASNQIFFTELAEDAKIFDEKQLPNQNQKSAIAETVIGGIIIFIWLSLIFTVSGLLWRMGKWWYDMDTGQPSPELKKRLITVLVIILIYNIVVFSLGPVSGFLPVPHISTDDLMGAFLLYLLVTRYKLIENWILSKKESLPTDNQATTTPPIPVQTISKIGGEPTKNNFQ